MDNRSEAKTLLRVAGITSSQSFDSLDSQQRDTIINEARNAYLTKHRKPMPDRSESYIRKRFDLLQSRART